MLKIFLFRVVLILTLLVSLTFIYYDFKEHNINTKLQTVKFNHESIIRLFNSSMHICHLGEKEIQLKISDLNNKLNKISCSIIENDTAEIIEKLIFYLNSENFKNPYFINSEAFHTGLENDEQKIGSTKIIINENRIIVKSMYYNDKEKIQQFRNSITDKRFANSE